MNKFMAKKTVYDGHTYDSKKEADYASKLDLLKKAQKRECRVDSYMRQVPYDLKVNGRLVCKYILDFLVVYSSGRVEHVDVKGYRGGAAYGVYRIKAKLMEAIFGIKIKEV